MAPRQEWLFVEGQYVAVPRRGTYCGVQTGEAHIHRKNSALRPGGRGYELEEEYVVAPRWKKLNEMEGRWWRPDERG